MSKELNFSLLRDAYGRLVLTMPGGEVHAGVVAVRAFPIAAPDCGISLLDAEGRELVWIEDLSELTAEMRGQLEQELASREFMPQINCIRQVSSRVTPSTWLVETDRGNTSFVLKGEEDIRRLGQTALLIADMHGVQFLIRDIAALDRASRKLLDHFL